MSGAKKGTTTAAALPIHWRTQGRVARAYIDLRRWGGVRNHPLKPAHGTRATTDPRLAAELATALVAKLNEQKRERDGAGLDPRLELRGCATQYVETLKALETRGERSSGWVMQVADMLARAVRFFDEVQPPVLRQALPPRKVLVPRNLAQIDEADIEDFAAWVSTQSNGRGGTYGRQTARHHVYAVSGLFQYAKRRNRRALRINPVRDAQKPSVPQSNTPLLEAEDVALALEGARLIQAEALAAGADPRQRSRRMVHVALTLLAYTGTREDECARIDWRDLMQMGDGEYVLRVYSASKGANAGKGRKVRLVPLSSHAVPVLLEWRSRSGRLSGPILADPETGVVPAFTKALRAVERRTGLPEGVLGSRSTRVAYATHRATCTGINWNDVRDELGHADLQMQGRVYGRGRLNREAMGDELDYRWERWSHLLGDRAAQLARSTATPDRWELGRAEREAVVRGFLAAIEGMGIKRAMRVTGVDKAVVQRLRTGRATDVKGKNLDLMRAWLELAQRSEGVA